MESNADDGATHESKSVWTTLLKIGLFLAIVCGFAGVFTWYRLTPVRKPAGILVTIGKSTTYITQPLRSDGYPDYVAALNQMLSKDVTPENNAVVLLVQAFGPKEIDANDRREFFAKLGIPELPEEGRYFVDWHETLKGEFFSGDVAIPDSGDFDLADQQRDLCFARPWKSEEFPRVAKWLAANQSQLAKIEAATKRTHFYAPVITENILLSALLPIIQTSREAARGLNCRAMNHLGEGRSEEGLTDLLSGHRLSRLVVKAPFTVGHLVGLAIEGIMLDAVQAALQYGEISRADLSSFRNQLSALGPMPSVSKALNESERMLTLDVICFIARNPQWSDPINTNSPQYFNRQNKNFLALLRGRIDWDVPLAQTNAWYDRLVAVASGPIAGRPQAIADFENGLNSWEQTCRAMPRYSPLGDTSSGELIAADYLGLFLPGLKTCYNAESRAESKRRAVQLACDLELFKMDHGSYPNALEELVPKYCSEIPKDAFADRPFVYRQVGDEFTLYSLGQNNIDDGGLLDDDHDDVGVTPPLEPTAAAPRQQSPRLRQQE